MQHPQIHEGGHPTPTGSAEPPRFDAKSVETHATHVELHIEEGELEASLRSDDDSSKSSKSSGRKSVTFHPHVDIDQSSDDASSIDSRAPDDKKSYTKDAPSTAAPLMPPYVDSIEKQKPLPKDDSSSRLKALIFLAVCAVAAALAAGSIVVTRQRVKGGGYSHLLQDTDENVDPDVSPQSSFWQDIQNRKDECLLYPRKCFANF
jgi:hypothetical protein